MMFRTNDNERAEQAQTAYLRRCFVEARKPGLEILRKLVADRGEVATGKHANKEIVIANHGKPCTPRQWIAAAHAWSEDMLADYAHTLEYPVTTSFNNEF